MERFKIKIKADKDIGKQIDMTIKDITDKGIEAETFYDSLIKFEDLRATGSKKSNIIDYMKAVEFCTYVVSGLDYTTSYRKTFPSRVAKHEENGKGEWISRYANVYAGGELVGNIMARIYMNQYIMFIDKGIKAKLELYNMGMGDGYEKDKINALDKFLVHIKKDQEQAGIVNNIALVNGKSIVDAIDAKLNELSASAKDGIEKGIIDATVVANRDTIVTNNE